MGWGVGGDGGGVDGEWGWGLVGSGGGSGVGVGGGVSISLQCFYFDAGVKISWRLNIFSHWLIISWAIRNKLQWNFNRNSTFFIKKMHLEMFANCRPLRLSLNVFMMTSSNGNIFRVTGPLCGEFTGHWLIHRSRVNSPHKNQWHGDLMFSLICAWWMDGWVNNR